MNTTETKSLKKGITVLICTHNGDKNLPDTLMHLSRQRVESFVEWEILLIDNASTDNSANIALKTWKSLHTHIPLTVLRENKPGKDNAIDLGFKSAEYSYVIICDDDNWLNENYIQHAYSIMTSHPEIGMLGGKGEPVFEEECDAPLWFNEFQKFYAVGPQAYLNGEIIHYWPTYRFLWGAGVVVNLEAYSVLQTVNFKRILSSARYPKVARSEDVELSLAIWLTGYKLWYDEGLTFQHFISKEKLKFSYLMKVVRQSISASHYLRPYRILLFTGVRNAPSKSFWKQYIIYHVRLLSRKLKSRAYFKLWMRVLFNRHLEDVLYVYIAIEWYQIKSVIDLGKEYDRLFKRTAQLQRNLSLVEKNQGEWETRIFNKNKREENLLPSAERYHWITCSLFAPMTIWRGLLTQFHHLLEELKNEFLYFQVQINDDKGSNIRIALLAKAENKQKICDVLSLRFKPLLSGFPIDDTKGKVDSIFLPYPTHVVEFDLYHVYYDEKLSDTYEVQQEISNLIIEVLKQDDIDLETITTFCFYVQVCLINAILKHPISEVDMVQMLSSHIPKNTNSIEAASNENMEILAQITSDIICAEEQEDELSWITKWMAFCEKSIEKHLGQHDEETSTTKGTLKTFYQSFVFRIHERMGLSDKSRTFLNYTVHRSISGLLQKKASFTRMNQKTSQITSADYDIQEV
jgi:glycosyltransferase involved in cell wall biosynthesis